MTGVVPGGGCGWEQGRGVAGGGRGWGADLGHGRPWLGAGQGLGGWGLHSIRWVNVRSHKHSTWLLGFSFTLSFHH